jgi:hypothetical protein
LLPHTAVVSAESLEMPRRLAFVLCLGWY